MKFNCTQCEMYHKVNTDNQEVVYRCCPFCASVLPKFINLEFTVESPMQQSIDKLNNLVNITEKFTATHKNPVVNLFYDDAKAILNELERLQQREKLLNALESCGVDNWNGFENAIEEYETTI